MASFTLSPSSVVANTTSNILTAVGTGTHFTASTPAFQLYTGYGLITNITVTDDTHATITLSAGINTAGYPATIGLQDVATGDGLPTATISATKPNLGALNWGYLGDSLYKGNGGNGIDYYANIWLTSQGYTPTLTNEAQNGVSSAYWAPAAGNVQAAVAAMVSAGVQLLHLMDGTNDVRTPNSFAPAVSSANKLLTAQYALANGIPKVIIHKQPITTPYAGTSGAQWPGDPNTLYCQQWALDVQNSNGSTIVLGDSGAYNYSYINMTTWTGDGVHPTTGNWQIMASMQSQAGLTPYGYPLQGGRIIGGGVGMIEPVAGLGALAGLLGSKQKLLRRNLLGRWARSP